MDKLDKAILAQTKAWSDLVPYHPGTIVSRTLMDQKQGTLTLFAFDAQEALSEHTAPFDAFVTILDGCMEIQIEKMSHTVTAGHCIIMPADKPHALKALEKTTMLLVMIRSE